jgi:osmotically-inducible protein OsmY
MRHRGFGTIATGAILTVLLSTVAPAAAQQQGRGKQDGGQRAQRQQQGQQPFADSSLEALLLRGLAEEAYVGKDFKIEVQSGVARLSGTVASAQDRARIVRVARRTPGITDVQANFRVAPQTAEGEPAVADSQLARQVAQRIASAVENAKAGEDWWLEGWRVEGRRADWSLTVEAENGNVFLEGQVPRPGLVTEALETALKTQGVMSVQSDIDVRGGYAGAPYTDYPYASYGTYDDYPYGYGAPAYGDVYEEDAFDE